MAFRANPDGSIPSGVGKEIDTAMDAMLIIELPGFALRKKLSIKETVEFLKEAGQR